MANAQDARPYLRRPIIMVLAIAAIVRIAYLSAYVTRLPFVYGPVGDSTVYLLQAQEILAGVFGTPAQLAFSPFYGYLLALVGRGHASILPVLLQLALGVGNVYLLYRLALRWFDERCAIASACLAVGYAALMFLESKLLSETCALALLMMALLSLTSRRTRHALPDCACLSGLAGALLGLAVLTRASMVFCLPLFVLTALFSWHGEPVRLRMVRALALGVGMAAMLTANGLWNLQHSGRFVPLILVSRTLEKSTQQAWTGSINVYASDKAPSPLDVVAQAARVLAEGDTSGSAPPSLAERWQAFDVSGLLRSAPSKWAGTFQNREMFFQYGFLGERDELPVLRALPVSFGALTFLAALGLFSMLRARRAHELWPLLPLVLGTLATTTIYHPSSRYRLPLVIPLVILAGHGLLAPLQLRGRLRIAATAASAAVVLALVVSFELRGLGNRPAWLLELAVSSFTAGEYDACERYTLQAKQLAGRDPMVRRRVDDLLAALAHVPRAQQPPTSP